ncbi:MAG: hypothetical protein NC915_06190, partial [Candidatus Omnitrophica bacterium]|nr:hypothetical protein [Candidatus Omnitrophota bacterium]
GTGLRASVLINIPGIKFFKKDKIIFNMIEKIGITIRGFYGEGSLPFGSIYQFSSTELVSKTEKEIIKELESVIKLVRDEEKKCIEEIKSDKKLREKICKNLRKEKEINCNYKKLYYLISLAYKTGILKIKKEDLKNLFFLFISDEENLKETVNYHFYKNKGKILKREILETLNV